MIEIVAHSKRHTRRSRARTAALFNSKHLTLEQADLYHTLRKISSDVIAEEESVAGDVWLAYGYMTPMERTRAFHDAYVAADHAARRRGSLSSAASSVERDYARNRDSTMSSLYRARQVADALGMPYQAYVRFAFEWCEKSNWENLPQPNQLYGDRLTTHVAARWEREYGTWAPFAHDWNPLFFQGSAGDERDAVQMRALDLVIVIVERSSVPEYALASLLNKAVISIEKASEVFREDLVAAALKMRSPGWIEQCPKDIAAPRWCRGHFGVRPDCHSCPVASVCLSARRFADQWLLKKDGCLDPRGDAKRRAARERQRQCRNRKRAANAA